MKTIWKYQLERIGETSISMPKGAEILNIGIQGNWLCLWALVDTEAEKESRCFMVYGTGWEIDNIELSYIDTFITEIGFFVWHFFEVLGGVSSRKGESND